MRLCIADPPYPPRYSERRDAGGVVRIQTRSRARRYYGDGTRSAKEKPADFHVDAGEWDDPARHRRLLEQLLDEFDGWAIATTPDGLSVYHPIPVPARIMVWHKPNATRASNRIHISWEAVIAYTPEGRRARSSTDHYVPDVLTCATPRNGFIGEKPPRWTRWVLDALGYDPDNDELVDMFPGSGAVSAAAAQGVLL